MFSQLLGAKGRGSSLGAHRGHSIHPPFLHRRKLRNREGSAPARAYPVTKDRAGAGTWMSCLPSLLLLLGVGGEGRQCQETSQVDLRAQEQAEKGKGNTCVGAQPLRRPSEGTSVHVTGDTEAPERLIPIPGGV